MTRAQQEYMRGRVEQLHGSIYADTEREFAAFLSSYREANDEILDELARLYAKYGTDEGLTLSEMHKYNRFQKLNASLKDIADRLGQVEVEFMESQLPEIWAATETALGEMLGGVDMAVVPRARVEEVMRYPWSGANFSDRVWENKRRLIVKLRETLTRGMVQGQSFRQMSAAIRDVMKAEAYVARRLVRTEAMFFMNQAQLDQYALMDVRMVEYIATYDERTCEICAPDDTRRFKLGTEIMLPRHPNCRCTYIPVVTGADNWSRFEPIGGRT